MSTRVCVCVSVCLSASIFPVTLARSFVHAAYGRGSVHFRRSDEIPRGRGNLMGFLPHWQCIIQHSILDPYKRAGPMEMSFGMMTRVGPRYHMLDGGPDIPREGAILGENVAAYRKVMRHSAVRCAKRLNRSRCRFGRSLRWTQGTMY